MTFARRVHWLKRAALPWWRGTGTAGVGLTFDDGPHPEHTPAVLDRLAAHGLTATFFLVGNRITDPAIVRQIIEAGHVVGNHTFSHAVPRWSDIAVSLRDVLRCQAMVPAARVFRPPLGRLTPGLWLGARRCGLKVRNWTLDSGDWRCRSAADAATCAAEVLALVRPGDVILFHDDHEWIAPILDHVLPALANHDGRVSNNPFPEGCGVGRMMTSGNG
ncbi:polysaccharide deacetylase family protein [Gemmata sp.]|uniref:polysaccharide deacetylase family protein n=1 Tax=Gemmata sp. TaxID=1914242 RepID=UPI003F6E443F